MRIIYNTNTGTTEKYALALAERLDCEAIPFQKAEENEDDVIFMSWVQMGQICLLPEARAKFSLSAVIAVGVMGLGEESKTELIEKNEISETFFLLPGTFSVDRLSGMYKMMMKMALAMMKSKVKGSDDPKDKKAFELFENGIDLYDESRLDEIVAALSGEGEE